MRDLGPIFLLCIILLISTGAEYSQAGAPGSVSTPAETVRNLRDYFPLTPGSSWLYQGEGNEYATFRCEVVRSKGDKYQVREDNGGTVIAIVYQVTEEAITQVFYKGEAYEDKDYLDCDHNDTSVILRTPLSIGTRWKDASSISEIVDVSATVETPAGVFRDCIEVRVTNERSTVTEYYKSGVGLVNRVFESDGEIVKSSLEQYFIKQ